MSKKLLLFRQDLRLNDNVTFDAAISGGELTAVFILSDPDFMGWNIGAASKWWLHHSLKSLQDALALKNIKLHFFQGDTKKIIAALIAKLNIDTLLFSRRYLQLQINADLELTEYAERKKIEVKTFNSHLLIEPWGIKNQSGKPYKVYTPYWRAASVLIEKRLQKKTANQESLTAKSLDTTCLSLEDLKLLPAITWDTKFYEMWKPGEEGARKALSLFLKTADKYLVARNNPAIKGTSNLSAHLHFGEISPDLVWQELNKIPSEKGQDKSYEQFLKELVWREFSFHLMYHFPHLDRDPLREEFKNFPWQTNKKAFTAWKNGMTGFPIVDAGMRQLWKLGWMHNRVRMIVASFLVKDLLIAWQDGAAWFWDTLIDADLANNTAGWQWVAGCGADAAPYFRVFNPILQGEKFDPDGDYIRAWIPELKDLPNKWIHRPFEADAQILKNSSIVLGKNYPHPIVDHAEAREMALKVFKSLRA